jgi:hypothetical protein
MAEFLNRLITASEGTGWCAETASSILSLKRRFEAGEITEEKYVEGLNGLKSGDSEIGAGGSLYQRAIIDNGIQRLLGML